MALRWKRLVGRRSQDGAGLEVFHQFGAPLVATPDVSAYPALEYFKLTARCRNLINPNPEKMKARFERAAEDGGYAYVGVSSTLDGPILVHGTTDDKAVLRSTLAREQWRTEERAMEWAMLLWLNPNVQKHTGYIRVKLMARCQHLNLLLAVARHKARLATARGGGRALPTWDIGLLCRATYCGKD